MGRAHPILAWFGLLFIILLTHTTTTSYPSAPCVSHSSEPDPMAIQTRTSGVKTRAAKANVSAVIRLRRNPRSTSRSPRGENVNVHLAELNLPGSLFNRGLMILGKEGQKDLDSLCILRVPTLEKTQEHAPPDSPVGVKEGIMVPTLNEGTFPPEQQAQPVIRINNNPTPSSLRESPATSDNNTAPISVLKNPSPAPAKGDESPKTQAPSLGSLTLNGLEQGSDYVIDRQNKMYIVYNENKKESRFHIKEFVGLFPSRPIIEMSITPTGSTKDERMTNFVRYFASLFAEIKYVDDTVAIAPINIYDDGKDNFITDRSSLPDNFTKLGKWLMISGGSWEFDKKDKGSGEVFAQFHLKSQEMAEEIINRVSFKFTCLGGSWLSKKAMQAMETKTPMMLLFVCKGTNHSSISTDIHQILDNAYKDINKEGMMPEQYESWDLPKFALRLNVLRLPEKKSAKDNKSYDHIREQGKKAFHLEVAKSDLAFFTFLATHAHRMRLDVKYFRKFAKLTATLGRDAPLSNCSWLRRCIQGHLNFHLSSTSVTINGIEDLDASEIV
jgi:hypothetical protein